MNYRNFYWRCSDCTGCSCSINEDKLFLLSQDGHAQDQPTPQTLMSDNAFQTLTKFLESVQINGASIDEGLSKANAEKKLLQLKIDALNRNIRDAEALGENNRRRYVTFEATSCLPCSALRRGMQLPTYRIATNTQQGNRRVN